MHPWLTKREIFILLCCWKIIFKLKLRYFVKNKWDFLSLLLMIFKQIIILWYLRILIKEHTKLGKIWLRILLVCNNYGSLFARYIVTPEKVYFWVIIEKENATLTSLEKKFESVFFYADIRNLWNRIKEKIFTERKLK